MKLTQKSTKHTKVNTKIYETHEGADLRGS